MRKILDYLILYISVIFGVTRRNWAESANYSIFSVAASVFGEAFMPGFLLAVADL